MTNVDLSDYKTLYLQTARKYITDMNSSLATLESDQSAKEAIETMYISAHSLKSQSQMMTYTQTGELCGTIETVFKNVREGKQPLTGELVGQLKGAITQISASVDAIEKENKELNLAMSIDLMKKFIVAG